MATKELAFFHSSLGTGNSIEMTIFKGIKSIFLFFFLHYFSIRFERRFGFVSFSIPLLFSIRNNIGISTELIVSRSLLLPVNKCDNKSTSLDEPKAIYFRSHFLFHFISTLFSFSHVGEFHSNRSKCCLPLNDEWRFHRSASHRSNCLLGCLAFAYVQSEK